MAFVVVGSASVGSIVACLADEQPVTKDKAPLQRFASLRYMTQMSLSSDDRSVIVANDGPTVEVYSTSTGKLSRVLHAGHERSEFDWLCTTDLALSHDSRTLALGMTDNSIVLWDTHGWHKRLTIHTKGLRIAPLAISPDGRMIASGSGATEDTNLWDARTGKLIAVLPDSKNPRSFLFTPRNDMLVTTCMLAPAASARRPHLDDRLRSHHTGIVALYAVPSGKLIGDISCPPCKYASVIALSPDGRVLAIGGVHGVITLWNVTTRELIRRLEGPVGNIDSAAFSPDGTRFAAASMDATKVVVDAFGQEKVGANATIRVWDAHSWQLTQTLPAHPRMILSLFFTHHGDRLIAGDKDGVITTWHVR
jgi:WD40 repeat protein